MKQGEIEKEAHTHIRPQPEMRCASNGEVIRVINGAWAHAHDELVYLLFFAAPLLLPYVCFPKLNGIYLYLIMCLICRFIVTKKSTNQYMSKMGQKTGTSNIGKKVIARPIAKDLLLAYQNLNSGSRRTNGLYS